MRLHKRLNHAVTGRRLSASVERDLGCSINELRKHLEAQFRDGWSWENYGTEWSIDHERPLASCNLADPEQFAAVYHYTNLRPYQALLNCKEQLNIRAKMRNP